MGRVDDLRRLAELLRRKNEIDHEIARLLGRPALAGHAGEYIAAAIFGIDLHLSAVHRGSDGLFTSGPLSGKCVNVKWYTAFCGLLDIRPDALPDYFLVLAGPRSAPASSRNAVLPWVIETVFLFDASALVAELNARGVKIGVATSMLRAQWDAAEIYPVARNPLMPVSEEQREMLGLFAHAPAAVGLVAGKSPNSRKT